MRKKDSKDTIKGTISSILDCGHLDFKLSEELCFGKWYYNSYIRDIARPAHRKNKGGVNSQFKNNLKDTATSHFHGWLKGRPKRSLEQNNKSIIRWNLGYTLRWYGPEDMDRKLKALPSSPWKLFPYSSLELDRTLKISSQLTSLKKVVECALDATVLQWMEPCMHMAGPAHLVPFRHPVTQTIRINLADFQVPSDSSVCACLVAQWSRTLCNSMNCNPPGSSVHGVFQARILDWVAISFSKGSCWSRDRASALWVFCHASGIFTTEPLGSLDSSVTCLKISLTILQGKEISLGEVKWLP